MSQGSASLRSNYSTGHDLWQMNNTYTYYLSKGSANQNLAVVERRRAGYPSFRFSIEVTRSCYDDATSAFEAALQVAGGSARHYHHRRRIALGRGPGISGGEPTFRT